MESKKLEALLMAVDLGSFTKAAEVMGYTQSGLTHMMNSLEREVGFTCGACDPRVFAGQRPARQRDRTGGVLTQRGDPRQRVCQHGHALAAEHYPPLP